MTVQYSVKKLEPTLEADGGRWSWWNFQEFKWQFTFNRVYCLTENKTLASSILSMACTLGKVVEIVTSSEEEELDKKLADAIENSPIKPAILEKQGPFMRMIEKSTSVSGLAATISMSCKVMEIEGAKKINISAIIDREHLIHENDQIWRRELMSLIEESIDSYLRTA